MTQVTTHRADLAAQQMPLAIQAQPLSFKFESLGIRVIVLDGDPWFIAVDVCLALGLDATAIRKLDDDEKGLHLMQTPGGRQKVAIVSESGMYTLVLRCRDAVKTGSVPHKFRKWVTAKVLPSIRKTGGYGSLPAIDVERLMTHDLPAPSVKLPPEVEDAIEERAWQMAREAHRISLRHLRGRVAFYSESGWPRDKIDTQKALVAVNETGLGTALTQIRRRSLIYLDAAIKIKMAFVPELASTIDSLVNKDIEISGGMA